MLFRRRANYQPYSHSHRHSHSHKNERIPRSDYPRSSNFIRSQISEIRQFFHPDPPIAPNLPKNERIPRSDYLRSDYSRSDYLRSDYPRFSNFTGSRISEIHQFFFSSGSSQNQTIRCRKKQCAAVAVYYYYSLSHFITNGRHTPFLFLNIACCFY